MDANKPLGLRSVYLYQWQQLTLCWVERARWKATERARWPPSSWSAPWSSDCQVDRSTCKAAARPPWCNLSALSTWTRELYICVTCTCYEWDFLDWKPRVTVFTKSGQSQGRVCQEGSNFNPVSGNERWGGKNYPRSVAWRYLSHLIAKSVVAASFYSDRQVHQSILTHSSWRFAPVPIGNTLFLSLTILHRCSDLESQYYLIIVYMHGIGDKTRLDGRTNCHGLCWNANAWELHLWLSCEAVSNGWSENRFQVYSDGKKNFQSKFSSESWTMRTLGEVRSSPITLYWH